MIALGKITVLGDVSAKVYPSNSINLSTRRSKELLSALTVNLGKKIRRDKLCSDLWPNSSDISGRKALNTELWRLKSAIRDADSDPNQWIQSTKNHIRICPENGLITDLDRLQSALSQHLTLNVDELLEATQLYKGEFASDIQSDWIEPIRNEIRRKFRSLVEVCINELKKAELYNQAYTYAKRLISDDPYDESGHRSLLLVQFESGDKSSALNHYRDYCSWLMSELGIAPSQETTQLVESYLDHSEIETNFTIVTPENFPYQSITSMRKRLFRMRKLANELVNIADEIEKILIK